MDEVTFILDSFLCGYHVYKDLWNATPGKTLTCIREWGNIETMCSHWQRKAMAILLGVYLGTFRVLVVRFLCIEKEY